MQGLILRSIIPVLLNGKSYFNLMSAHFQVQVPKLCHGGRTFIGKLNELSLTVHGYLDT